jgi:transposase
LQAADLSKLIAQMGEAANRVKEITRDLSPTYEKFAAQRFPKSTVIADKFHVVKQALHL